MKTYSDLRARITRAASDDSGLALMTVVMVAVVIFALIAATLVMTGYRDVQTRKYSSRVKAMQMADAGLNEYMYQLSEDYRYYTTHATLTPSSPPTGGTWRVQATAPHDADLLTLVSTATMADGTTRSIKATVKFPNFVDYCVFVIDDYSVGSGFTFDGKVYVQGWLDMNSASRVTGLAKSSKGFRIGGVTQTLVNNKLAPGTVYQGGGAKVATLSMSSISADLAAISASATAAGINIPAYSSATYGSAPTTWSAASTSAPTGRQGYRLTFNNANVTVEAIRAERQYDGELRVSTATVLAAKTVPVPANGIIYVNGTCWVQGTYSTKVTIAVPGPYDILVPGDLLCSASSPKATMGLVSGGDIGFPWWYLAMPSVLDVQAAMMSQSGYVNVDPPMSKWRYYSSQTANRKNTINMTGSRAMDNQGNGLQSGFVNRNSVPDPRLYDDPPPMYPNVQGDKLQIKSWSEY